jgi:hypothetical protein
MASHKFMLKSQASTFFSVTEKYKILFVRSVYVRTYDETEGTKKSAAEQQQQQRPHSRRADSRQSHTVCLLSPQCLVFGV